MIIEIIHVKVKDVALYLRLCNELEIINHYIDELSTYFINLIIAFGGQWPRTQGNIALFSHLESLRHQKTLILAEIEGMRL